jgi:hypothetical protein
VTGCITSYSLVKVNLNQVTTALYPRRQAGIFI